MFSVFAETLRHENAQTMSKLFASLQHGGLMRDPAYLAEVFNFKEMLPGEQCVEIYNMTQSHTWLFNVNEDGKTTVRYYNFRLI
jgi:hypothetical protein